jgi:hypothetical protein
MLVILQDGGNDSGFIFFINEHFLSVVSPQHEVAGLCF